MEEIFEGACQARLIPGAVLMAADKSGNFSYSRAFGARSMQPPLDKEPLTVNSIMYVASCTKLLTSIAVMQCIERGLVILDQDVRPIVQELQDLDILQGDSHGNVVSKRKNTAPITLRQLLTHTSGFSYEFNEPLLQRWRSTLPDTERRPPTSVRNRFLHPLLYEPGTSFSYGPSIDWAGVVVERVTGSTLQEYMMQHIWEPLGIKDMTFFLSRRPDMQARVAHMSLRDGSIDAAGQQTVVYAPVQPVLNPDGEDCQGGGGIFTSAAEYVKVLQALLRASDSPSSDLSGDMPRGQLLKRSTVDTMFNPQLGPSARKALQAISEIPRLNNMMGGMPPQAGRDWGLAGLLLLDDLPGWRQKGTMTWGGTPNLTWWIDRKAGLCGLYAGQLMPLGDAKSVEMTQLFEKEMYARHSAAMSG
ncbi:acyltransferase LovD [Diplogelasinospora grovesii]|uniref:Acyltransferase LovD n=1 Tax=Diplogelasinospora grovesii TaxID=303347 RepID=A0AAN6MYH8_9PEZI|nr:acyltransferase LovD [Diplogelasinospora grovesii]